MKTDIPITIGKTLNQPGNFMNRNSSFEALYHRYLANELSEEELREFLLQIHEKENEEKLATLMEGSWNQMYETTVRKKARITPLFKRRTWLMVAAAVVLVASVGSYFFFFNSKPTAIPQPTPVASQEQRFKNDVAPGKEGAILTLSDGRKILLDSAGNGMIAQQGNTKVINKNGQLAYAQGGKAEVVYNTMSTPRGRKYNLVLPDGSKVWLDASSSITFPTAFVGGERKVTVTGQAYFSVKHNSSQPFKVRVKGADGTDRGEIEDLGTEFNIDAYSESVKTTLVEGKVRVSNNKRLQTLAPGQQAILRQAQGDIAVANDVNVDEVVAWKNDLFYFRDADIKTIMNQVERWYDVDIIYEDKPTDRFVSTIPRDVPVSQVFKILETTGRVHFRIDGKKVTVMK